MQIHKHIKYSNTNQTLNVFLNPKQIQSSTLEWILFDNLLYVKFK